MGGAAREKPARLPAKLRAVREALGLSQSEIWRRLGLEERMNYTVISNYESGLTEPSLPVLLSYAKLAGVCVDYLIDDELDLPKSMHGRARHRIIN